MPVVVLMRGKGGRFASVARSLHFMRELKYDIRTHNFVESGGDQSYDIYNNTFDTGEEGLIACDDGFRPNPGAPATRVSDPPSFRPYSPLLVLDRRCEACDW
jgi:hypothetical protein